MVFGVLFSLLYASGNISSKNSDALFTVLETKKAEASIFRLDNSETTCFRLNDDDQIVKNYSFSSAVREADGNAELRPEPINNRFGGFSMGINATDIIPLIRQYQEIFNHTTTAVSIRNYADETHMFECNFTYNGNQYYLVIEFRSLTAINEKDGFVAIDVRDNGTATSQLITYYTFNNTAIWTNHLDSPVTLTVTTQIDNEDILLTTQIPPGKSWDYRLSPDYSSANGTLYFYQVRESSSNAVITDGVIIVKYYPKCMSQRIAKSLYSQSGIALKFPDYLPDGYSYICGIHYYNDVIIQAYWNRTVDDPLAETFGESKVWDFPNYAFHPEALDNGVIQLIAGRAGTFTGYSDANERFEDIKDNRAYLDQQLIEVWNVHDGKRYGGVAYRHNILVEKDINIVELYDKDKNEFYFLKAKLPLRELVLMAESLNS